MQFIHKNTLFVVDRASLYIRVMKTNFMNYLLNSDGPDNRQSSKKHNTYQLLYIYSIPRDDGLQIFPKHVEVD
jgi:hypothetical protein